MWRSSSIERQERTPSQPCQSSPSRSWTTDYLRLVGWPDNGFAEGASRDEIFRVSQRLGFLMFILLFGGIVVFIYLAY